MGREAEIGCSFEGQNAVAKVSLESDAIILRGAIKARIPRSDITSVIADGADLLVQTSLGPLRLALGGTRAVSWALALTAPPPSLAQKLGIGPDRQVWVLGSLSDPALIAALAGATAQQPGPGAMVLAELLGRTDLDLALDHLRGMPGKPFWGVTVKGASSPFPESALRATMRASGYIDTKSCAVSQRMTATRYTARS